MEQKVKIKLEPGAKIFFGCNTYRVLDVDKDKKDILVVSDKTICDKHYYEVTWETSTIRQWLNNEFLDEYFTSEEQEAIVETNIINKDNDEYGTKGGNDTVDKVFLLSIDEARKYFKNNKDRAASGDSYWLRSPGVDAYNAARVNVVGYVGERGVGVHDELGIRPAFHLNLESEIFKSSNQQSGFEIGEHIIFGKKEIQWRILDIDKQNKTIFVVSVVTICDKPYQEVNVTWETSPIREWLNHEFLNGYFISEEQEAIVETNVDNKKYRTKGGNNTVDKVFLLSIEEARKYFKNAQDRATGNYYWLRSPGDIANYAAFVHDIGVVNEYGHDVNYEYGIRPAFHLNLESEIFQSDLEITDNEMYMYTLIPSQLEYFEIPETIRGISDNAFVNCTKLKRISMPTNLLKDVSKTTFSGCSNIMGLNIQFTDINEIPYFLIDYVVNDFIYNHHDLNTVEGKQIRKYIRSAEGKEDVFDLSLKDPKVLAYLCENKLIQPRYIEKFKEAFQQENNLEGMTMIMDYEQNKLTQKEKDRLQYHL